MVKATANGTFSFFVPFNVYATCRLLISDFPLDTISRWSNKIKKKSEYIREKSLHIPGQVQQCKTQNWKYEPSLPSVRTK